MQISMSNEQLRAIGLSLASAALLTASQAAVGFGLGLLVAERMEKRERGLLALGALSLAALATSPALIGVAFDLVNGPHSRLGVRRTLRSIREDSGIHDEDQVF
jgi:hypothetical protein